MPITEAELNEIEARANAADEGPWYWTQSYELGDGVHWALSSPESKKHGRIIDASLVLDHDRPTWFDRPCADLPNWQFIAHARADIPKLIAEVRELQAQLNSKPQRKSKKKQIEEQFRESDLTAARSGGRPDVDYGPHDSLPRGEHVAREGFKVKQRNG